MFDAIAAQPAAIAEVVARNREGIAALARALKQTPSLTLAGLGTSLNGAHLRRVLAAHDWPDGFGPGGKLVRRRELWA